MDPNATLRDINDFLADRHVGEKVDIWCEYLYDWLSHGGFNPDWDKYPLATDYYRLRAVSIERGERVK